MKLSRPLLLCLALGLATCGENAQTQRDAAVEQPDTLRMGSWGRIS